MHTSSLAFYSPLLLSVACFLAGGVWLMLWSRQRTTYMLVSALPWWAFTLYFGLLTISAGSVPVVTRTEIAGAVREWGFVVAALIVAGKLLLLRAWWRSGVERREREQLRALTQAEAEAHAQEFLQARAQAESGQEANSK